MADNHLYYGDNLDILRRYVKDESVDLIYLDPPFNSNADYNVLFHERDGKRAAAQIQAFTDTWAWNVESERAFWTVTQAGGQPAQAMAAFRTLLGENDMLAYLAMMAPRLIELRRVLKPTGSIYLHCDPTASHYLKVLMDAIYSPTCFISEITWKRTHSHGDSKRKFGAICDIILAYGKTDEYTFNEQHVPFTKSYIDAKFRYSDANGRLWQSVTLRSPNPRPNLTYPYTASNGVTYLPHPNGWSCNIERMKQYDSEGRLHFPAKSDGNLRLKMYLDESPGVKLQSLWDDIAPLNSQAQERLRYPTQKPEALLERIIQASSNSGDVVLDPFCGCGTAIAAAQKLSRRWVGIDITHVSIGLMKSRLLDSFGPDIASQYDVTGEPTTLPDAEKLAADDKFQFQAWALGLVGARTATSANKGADGGIDGRLIFHEGDNKPRQVILSVKGGALKADDIRALGHVVDREGADIGVLLTMNEPSQPMRADAASKGFYSSPWGNHPRLQILTIRELLDGKRIDMPQTAGINITFKQAPKAERAAIAAQPKLMEG